MTYKLSLEDAVKPWLDLALKLSIQDQTSITRIIAEQARRLEVAKDALNKCRLISGGKMDYGSSSTEIQKIFGCSWDAYEIITSKEPCV
jgi:hypothetical protein